MIKYLACCMIFFSCASKTFKQSPKVQLSEVVPDCEELYKLIQDKWYKHKKYPCHVNFPEAFTLAQRFESCFLKMHKTDILQLLGSPDNEVNNLFTYIFKDDCNKLQEVEYCLFIVQFTSNSVSKVESECHSGIE